MTAEGSRHSARCTVSAQRRRVAFSCPVVSSTCGPLTRTARGPGHPRQSPSGLQTAPAMGSQHERPHAEMDEAPSLGRAMFLSWLLRPLAEWLQTSPYFL